MHAPFPLKNHDSRDAWLFWLVATVVLFAGLASSIFAAYCWMRGLATLGAERTSVFMNLMPLCTALIAVISLGEPIHGHHLIGGGLILTGVMISQFKPRARPARVEGA